ncbi:hypothetical protein GOP47_0000022 [Adiantum capillus-veneris]|uniref:Uncharacterized protein n=1 Tax=Adiantum capillus-veneris TaxID=13818 RepID=A0A9D4VE49_ADICA|nr:hypothetical protein GOP47_0000022 [Adiantum capillus-veneris]
MEFVSRLALYKKFFFSWLRYLQFMDFGVLKAMADIQSKASDKLLYQGEASFMEMLTSYKSLVESLSLMRKAGGTMKTYLKGPVTGNLIEFSDQQHLDKDAGDGDGLPVFSTLSVYTHEMLAQELLDMFIAEIKIKWLVISELHRLLYLGVDVHHPKRVDSKKLMDNVHTEAAVKLPWLLDTRLEHDSVVSTQQGPGYSVKREVFQVYLTAWLTEVNVRKSRKDEILKLISEDMQFSIQG